MMLLFSALAIAVFFGLLWIAVRLTVIAARAIEQRQRRHAKRATSART